MTEELTFPELMGELAALRQRVAELEAREEQIRNSLAQERDLLHALMDSVPDSIYFKDVNLRFIRVNKVHARFLGYDNPAEVIGRTGLNFQSPELVQAVYEEEREIIKTGRAVIDRVEFDPARDQQPCWLSVTKTPIRNEAGQTIGLVAVSRNISVLAQTATALRKSEATQRAILGAIPDLMFRLSRDGVLLDFNAPQMVDLIAAPSEFLGKKISEVLPPELVRRVTAAIERIYRTNEAQTIEYELLLQGEIRYFEARLVRSGVNEILVIVRNITDRRRTEEALRQSEATQRALLDAIPDFLFRINRNGDYIPFHTPHSTDSQVETRKIEEALPPDLAQHILAAFEQVFQTGETLIFEYTLPFPGEIRHYEARLVSSGDEILCILRDITERKRAEERLRLQNKQLQERNQELDAYARTVAHDLRNPLAILTTTAEVLAEDYTRMSAEQLNEYLHGIVRSGHKASRIVDGLLLLAGVRQQAVTLQPLDMTGILIEAQERLAEMIKEHQAEIITPPTWPTAWGYAPWIEEVWVNYMSNGLKYGGQPPRLELGGQVQADGLAHFWVKDNGQGLTPEAQAQLFTEFTQLDPERAGGYGLGLSIVRRIVERLGGQVGVESEGKPGRGSTFSFTLPLAKP